MRAGTRVLVCGAGCQHWEVDFPREGTFGDVAKFIPHAKEFYLRPDSGGHETVTIPMELSLYDLRLCLAEGYHIYAEVHPVSLAFQVNRGQLQFVTIPPSATIEEFLQHHCPKTVVIDTEAHCVFAAASVELLQTLGMGTRENPLHLQDTAHPGGQSKWTAIGKPLTFSSLGSTLSSMATALSLHSVGSKLNSIASAVSDLARRPRNTPVQHQSS
eukprot:jgi/Ulvmu1/6317/UM029_0025.1